MGERSRDRLANRRHRRDRSLGQLEEALRLDPDQVGVAQTAPMPGGELAIACVRTGSDVARASGPHVIGTGVPGGAAKRQYTQPAFDRTASTDVASRSR